MSDESADDIPQAGQSDKDIIDDAKAFLEFVNSVDGDNREAALDDLNFLAGDQWDDRARRTRELDGRPCLTINKLPTFLHQITNDQRQNVCSIKISAASSGANVKTAEIIQGMVRHDEYASNADIAYDTAVNSAAAIGVGYFRLVTDYCRPDSFDQEIRWKRVRNPFTVYFDPASEEPDGSDASRVLISSKVEKRKFKLENPGASYTTEGFDLGVGDSRLDNWIWEDYIREAEFYRIELEKDTLVELSNGESGYKSKLLEMPEGITITRQRPTMRRKVMWYKLTALEVLDRTEIMCDWIPVFPIYGDEIDIDGKVIRAGLIRNAKDPARMYNYWMTSATEEVALRTKTPFIGAEGQFEGYEEEWSQANVRSLPYLEYKPVSLDGGLAPAPQRQPMADVPVGTLRMSLQASDDIKATTGLFDSSLGARGTATSGIQERAQQRQGDLANYHYTDNRNRSVRQAGRCYISMMRHYYDAQRVVKIMGEDGNISFAEINKPASPEELQQQQKEAEEARAAGKKVQEVQQVLNDLTVGEYGVTVSAGPSYDTLRQEAVEGMVATAKAWPKLMEVAGDKVIRNMDWPGADEIADRVAKTLPPGLADEDQETPMVQTPKGPIPVDQAGQMLQEMDMQIQQMGQELQKAQAGIQKAQIDAASREKVAEINAVSKQDTEELKGMIQLLVAKATAPPELAEDVSKDLDKNPGDDEQKRETTEILKQLVAMQQQAMAPKPPEAPRKRRLSIQAPSGAVYQGEIADDAPIAQPAPEAIQ